MHNTPKAKRNLQILIPLAFVIFFGFLAWAWLSTANSFEYHANPTAQIGTAATITIPEVEPIMATVYAYNPLACQTDDTPYLTAYNEPVREGIVANNCLPNGTKVEIEGKVYTVADKMNPRYGCDVYDIFFFDQNEALEWGRKEVEIIEL